MRNLVKSKPGALLPKCLRYLANRRFVSRCTVFLLLLLLAPVAGQGQDIELRLRIFLEGPLQPVFVIANAGPNQTVEAGARVTLDGSASRAVDGGELSYQWQQIGTPAVTFTNNIPKPVFTAPEIAAAITRLTFELVVTDNRNPPSLPDRTVVIVESTNRAPAADAGDDQVVRAGAPVTLGGGGSIDPDGDALSYGWVQTSGMPTVVLSGARTSTATFTAPNVAADAVLSFSLEVTDGRGGISTDTVSVMVKANRAPVANAGDDQLVRAGALVTLGGGGSIDPDGDALSYQWVYTNEGPEAPPVTLSDERTSTATFTAPNVAADAVLSFRLEVSDGRGGISMDTVLVTVRANLAPEADAGDDQVVRAGALVTLDGGGSIDPDGDALSYGWVQTSGTPTVVLSGERTSTATFTAPDVAADVVLSFSLEVRDGRGGVSTDTVLVAVRANRAPMADAGDDRLVRAGALVTLDGGGSTDPDGDALSYGWTQTDRMPTVALSGERTAMVTFTSPSSGVRTVLLFSLEVRDGRGGISTDTVAVTVRSNRELVADAGDDQVVREGARVTLDGTRSSDPDGGALDYLWMQTGGALSVTLSSTATSATTTFTAPNVVDDVTLSFELGVRNDLGGAATDTVLVTVRANRAPMADAGDDQVVREGAPVTLDGTRSSDPEGDALSYRWVQTSGMPANLSGERASTATFTAPDPTMGVTLEFRLEVTDERGAVSSDTVAVFVLVPPVIGGTAEVGSGLTASVSVMPESYEITWRWYRGVMADGTGGAMIAGATAPTYTIGASDAGERLGAEVRYRLAGGTNRMDVAARSNATAFVLAAAPVQPVISGMAVVGSDLTAAMLAAPKGHEISWQWYRNVTADGTGGGAINNGRSRVYAVSMEDAGSRLAVAASYRLTFDGRHTARPRSAATEFVLGAPAAVSITGFDAEDPENSSNLHFVRGAGQVLTADVDNLPGHITTYHWYRHVDAGGGMGVTIAGETARTYTTVADDVGFRIGLSAFHTRTADGMDSSSIRAAVPVGVRPAAIPQSPVLSKLLLSVGEFVEVTAASRPTPISDFDIAWEWAHGESATGAFTVITGETGTGYTPPAERAGRYLRVSVFHRATATRVVNSVRASAVTSGRVLALAPPRPVIAGTAAVGARLTASVGVIPQGHEAVWQWYGNVDSDGTSGMTIAGAVSSVYIVPADRARQRLGVDASYRLINEPGRSTSVLRSSATDIVVLGQPPAADAGGNQTVAEGTTVTLDGSGSSDPEMLPLSYDWQRVSGPAVTLSGQTIRPTFLAPNLLTTTTLVFRLRVVDSAGNTSLEDEVTITVNADDDPPVADAGEDREVAAGVRVMLNGGGVDPEGQALSYSWTQTSGTSVPLTGASSATLAFTAPPTFNQDIVLVFALRVAELGGRLSPPSSVAVTVLSQPLTPDSVSIGGHAEGFVTGTGNVLSAVVSPALPRQHTANYRWLRGVSANGSGGSAVPGSTATFYITTGGDSGYRIGLEVSFTRIRDSQTSTSVRASAPVGVRGPAPAALTLGDHPLGSLPAEPVMGTAIQPSVEPVRAGYGIRYQWMRRAGLSQDLETIAGATSRELTPGESEVGQLLAVVAYHVSNDPQRPVASARTPLLSGAGRVLAGRAPPRRPVLAGASVVGGTLIATVAGALPSNHELVWRWHRGVDSDGANGVTIAGETSAFYQLQSDDEGMSLAVEAAYRLSGTNRTAAFSQRSLPAAVAARPPAPADVEIGGASLAARRIAHSGDVLSVSAASPPAQHQHRYRWYVGVAETGASGQPIAGATLAMYTVRTADLGKRIGVGVATRRNSDGRLSLETRTPAPVTANDPPRAVVAAVPAVGPHTGVTLDGSASRDPEGGALTYAWEQTGGSAVMLSSSTAAQSTFVTSDTGVLVFRLTVTDSHGQTGTTSAEVVVGRFADPIGSFAPPHPVAGQQVREEWRCAAFSPALPQYTQRQLTVDGEIRLSLEASTNTWVRTTTSSQPGFRTVSASCRYCTPSDDCISTRQVQRTLTTRPGTPTGVVIAGGDAGFVAGAGEVLSSVITPAAPPAGHVIHHRWIRGVEADGTGGEALAGETAASYTTRVQDLGARLGLAVAVVHTTSGLASDELRAAPVGVRAPAPPALSFSGLPPLVGVELSVAAAPALADHEVVYEWSHRLRTADDFVAIEGAGSRAYTPQSSDLGRWIRLQAYYRPTAAGRSVTSSRTTAVTTVRVAERPAGSVSLASAIAGGIAGGHTHVGTALRAAGAGCSAATTFSYEWFHASTPTVALAGAGDFGGATAAAYTTTPGDAGRSLGVRAVCVHAATGARAALEIAAERRLRVLAVPPAPDLFGLPPTFGNQIRASGTVPSGYQFSGFHWTLDGANSGVTGRIYTPEPDSAALGKTIALRLTATHIASGATLVLEKTAGVPASVQPGAVSLVPAPIVQVGARLTVSGSCPISIGSDPVFIQAEWLRDGKIVLIDNNAGGEGRPARGEYFLPTSSRPSSPLGPGLYQVRYSCFLQSLTVSIESIPVLSNTVRVFSPSSEDFGSLTSSNGLRSTPLPASLTIGESTRVSVVKESLSQNVPQNVVVDFAWRCGSLSDHPSRFMDVSANEKSNDDTQVNGVEVRHNVFTPARAGKCTAYLRYVSTATGAVLGIEPSEWGGPNGNRITVVRPGAPGRVGIYPGANAVVGDRLTGDVGCPGMSTPLYQWKRNGANISTATNASVTAEHAGAYVLSAECTSNGETGPSTESSVLTVAAPSPGRPPQPTTVTVTPAGNVGTGDLLTGNVGCGTGTPGYRWQFNRADIPGGATAGLIASSAGEVVLAGHCEASGVAGSPLRSAPVPVGILAPFSVSILPPAHGRFEAGAALRANVVCANFTTPRYQWGFGGADVAGETGVQYTPAGAGEVTLRAHCGQGTLTSAASLAAPVQVMLPLAAPQPFPIAGDVTVAQDGRFAEGAGRVLRAVVLPPPPGHGIGYQWLRGVDKNGAGGSAIMNRTGASYTTVSADVDLFTGAEAFYIRNADGRVSRRVRARTAIGVRSAPPAAGFVFDGETLTQGPTQGLTVRIIGVLPRAGYAVEYDWRRRLPDGVSEPIPGLTMTLQNFIVPGADELGHEIIVQARYRSTDSSRPVASAFADLQTSGRAVLANTAPPQPAISGAAAVGNVLSASVSSAPPPGHSIGYQWLRGVDENGAGGSAIEGAVQPTYVPGAADAGKRLAVEARFGLLRENRMSPPAVSPPTAAVAGSPDAPTGVSISGHTAGFVTGAGQVLTASVSGALPDAHTRAVIWLRGVDESGAGGAAIPAAADTTYTTVSDDIGWRITAAAANRRTSDGALSARVRAASPVGVRPLPPTLTSGTGVLVAGALPAVGDSLTLSSLPDAQPGYVLRHEWARGLAQSGTFTPIAGTVLERLQPAESDAGYYIRIAVWQISTQAGRDVPGERLGGVTTGAVLSARQPPQPVINGGVSAVGDVLTASVGGTAPQGHDVAWQWYRGVTAEGSSGTAISGATGMNYTLAAGDVNERLLVSAAYRLAGTARIVENGDVRSDYVSMRPLVVRAQPQDGLGYTRGRLSSVFAGTALRASYDCTGGSTVGYTWESRRSTQPLSTSPTYTVLPADEGMTIEVAAACDGDVEEVRNVLVLANPVFTIDGEAAAGRSVRISGAAAPLDVRWQKRTGGAPFADINGETGAVYLVRAQDAGAELRAVFTAARDPGGAVARPGGGFTAGPVQAVPGAPQGVIGLRSERAGVLAANRAHAGAARLIASGASCTQGTLEYAWYYTDAPAAALPGAMAHAGVTGAAYAPPANGAGKVLAVRAVCAAGSGAGRVVSPALAVSTAAQITLLAAPVPVLGGAPIVGLAVTLAADGHTFNDVAWFTRLPGAAATAVQTGGGAYTVSDADLGAVVRATAGSIAHSASGAVYSPGNGGITLETAASASALQARIAPAAGTFSANDSLLVGETLEAAPSGCDDAQSVRWMHVGNDGKTASITTPTAPTYTPSSAGAVYLRVTCTRGGVSAEANTFVSVRAFPAMPTGALRFSDASSGGFLISSNVFDDVNEIVAHPPSGFSIPAGFILKFYWHQENAPGLVPDGRDSAFEIAGNSDRLSDNGGHINNRLRTSVGHRGVMRPGAVLYYARFGFRHLRTGRETPRTEAGYETTVFVRHR